MWDGIIAPVECLFFFLLIHNTGKYMHTVQVEVNSGEVDNDNQPAGRDEAYKRMMH